MNYVRPSQIPSFVDFLEKQEIDVSAFNDALNDYLARAELVVMELDPFQDPETYLDSQNYLDNIRALQTIFFYEGFKS